MRHLCVPLFLVMISGVPTQTADEVSNVTGYEGGDVLLPCKCGDRDLKKVFKWQTENPASLIFKDEPPKDIIWGNYTTSIDIFLNENSSNCSILLKNITVDDNKTYTCRFIRNGVSKVHQVNLTVIQQPATGPSKNDSKASHGDRAGPWYFTIIPVVALLLLVGYLRNIYLKQRRNWGAPNQGETSLSSEV